jgi:hypothetical protein
MFGILCTNIFDAANCAADQCQTNQHHSDRMATSLTNLQHYKAESNDCYTTTPAKAHGSVYADGIHGMQTFNTACKEGKTTASTKKATATICRDIHKIILIEFTPHSVMVTGAAYQVSFQCL